jgi:hypothetical protein
MSLKLKTFIYDAMIRNMEGIARRVVDDNFSMSVDDRKVVNAVNRSAVEAIFKTFSDEVNAFCRKEYSNEIMDIVRDMPKEDMATLAEALVEITALRKRVSSTVESVGGPVDVAVITKGDGFVWIKRKHYFDIDKNLDFLYRRSNFVAGTSLLSGGLHDTKDR